MTADFPIADRNRLVKEASGTLLNLRKPGNWHPEPFGGDNDFGLDVHVQVSGQAGVRHAFYVQLKGTESPDLTADGSYVRYPLKRTTLNYYASLPLEVMLVVCVVAFDDSGSLRLDQCDVYWEWISNALKKKRGSEFDLDLSDAQTTTIHLPIGQRLTSELDISERLQNRIRQLRFAASLEEILASSGAALSKDPATALTQWAEVMRNKPEDFAALVLRQHDSNSAWLPPEAIEIRALLRAGRTESAASALQKLGTDGFGPSQENKALWFSLNGKVAMQRKRREEALQLFEAAYVIDPSENYLLALAEVKFLSAIDSNRSDEIVAVSESLASARSDEGLALLVRVKVALKDFSGAQKCIEQISPPNQLIPKLVLLSGAREWERAIALALEAEDDQDISDSDRIAVQLVAARAAWFKTLASSPDSETNEETPLSGPVGADHVSAQTAWRFAVSCAKNLRSAGWPPNSELLAPVVCAIAGIIGAQEEAISLLNEAADARPEYLDLQHALELLAIGAGNPETALKANLRQGNVRETLVRRVGLHFQLRQHFEGVLCALELARGNSPLDSNAAIALAMGYASARKIARMSDADVLRSALVQHPKFTEFLAFAEFSFSSLEQPRSSISLDHLRSGLTVSPDSWLLAANLYSNLDVSDAPQALEAISLARILRRHALLTKSEAIQEVYALSTLERWQDAAIAANGALERFGDDQRLLSLLAVAEEKIGRTSVAISVLERAMALGDDRVAILHNYMSIALRLGRIECVRQSLDRLLAIDVGRSERLELLRLRALLHVQEGEHLDARRLVMEVGRVTDTANEDEEGMFLNLFMAVTLGGPDVEDADAATFSQRMDAFCQTWPESKNFRKIEIPGEEFGTNEALHRLLDPLVGDSRARMREFQKRERQLQHGEAPVPFIVRPGYAIHYVGNPFDLWAIAKQSKDEAKQFHLQSALTSGDLDRDRSARSIPLLDLTALLLLDSLSLFGALFDTFRSVAIPRQTIGYISQHANSILAGGPGVSIAKSILVNINRWIDRIEQPGSKRESGGVLHSSGVLMEYLQLGRVHTNG